MKLLDLVIKAYLLIALAVGWLLEYVFLPLLAVAFVLVLLIL